MGSALVRLVSLAIVAMLVIPPAQMVSAQENVQTRIFFLKFFEATYREFR